MPGCSRNSSACWKKKWKLNVNFLMNHPEPKPTLLDELEEISDVPTLPHVATQLITLLDDPDVSFKRVATLIEEDPPLVAKILKLINSGYYHLAKEIRDVKQAIVYLGLDEIRNLVFAMSVYSTFYNVKRSEYFDYSQFWVHSAGTAKMAMVLSKYLKMSSYSSTYIAGLLHDFGRLVLQFFFSEQYQKVFQKSMEENVPLIVAERNELGLTHAQVGFWLAERWGLPESIALVMLNHHEVTEKDLEQNPLLALVHFANTITNIWGATLEPNPPSMGLDEDPLWLEFCQLHPDLRALPMLEMLQVFDMHLEEAESFVEKMEQIKKITD